MAQAYRWSYDEIAKLTYPQILMLNAAAEVNRKRVDQRIKDRRDMGDDRMGDSDEMPVVNGKRLDDMTSEEYMDYVGREGPRPRVIKVKPREA